MKNLQLLKTSIESLKGLRAELHDDIGSSKRKKLDQIIKNLECCEDQQISPKQILILLGKALALLPTVERILDEFNK